MGLEEAIGCFTTALALCPKAKAAYIILGITLIKKNQTEAWDAAVYAFKQALMIDPKFMEAHFNLGITLIAKNQLHDSKFVLAHPNLGSVLTAQLDEAIAEFRSAIELAPRNAKAHLNLGAALQAKNRLNEAIVEYRTAVEVVPNDAKAHFNLGSALQAKNPLSDEAITEYRSQRTRSQVRDAPRQPRQGFPAKNRLDDAINEYRKASELDPKDATVHVELGDVLPGQEPVGRRHHRIPQGNRTRSELVVGHYNFAIARMANNQPDEAINEYRNAIALQPDFAEAHCNLAQILRSQGQLSASLDFYKRGHAQAASARTGITRRCNGWRTPNSSWGWRRS